MGTLYLVSCSKKKRAVPLPAADLYAASTRFLLSRRYVEALNGRWCILSAKHGVLKPDQVIEPYDQTLNSMTAHERRQWASEVLVALEPHLAGVQHVRFLAGRAYYGLLLEPLRNLGLMIETPLAHMRQGEQLAFLKRETEKACRQR